jgi:type IV secretion system protein VirD4
MTRAIEIVLVAGITLVVILGTSFVGASYTFVYIGGLQNRLPSAQHWFAWWLYASNQPGPWTKALLAASAAAPLLVLILIGTMIWRGYAASRMRRRLVKWPGQQTREVERGVTDNHGHADWMSHEAARRIFPGSHPDYGGKVVGALANGELLVDPCTSVNGLSLEFAGSGGFKTSCAVTTLMVWHGTSVVLDPSCEVGPMTYKAMENAGKRVVMLSPDHDPQDKNGEPVAWLAHLGQVNVLDWIDIEHERAPMHVHTVANWILDEPDTRNTDTGRFFRQGGKDLLICLLAHVLWTDGIEDGQGGVIPAPPRTLATVRDFLSLDRDRLIEVLACIQAGSPSTMARHLAGPLVRLPDETFGGIHKEADQATSWLTVPAFADLVSGSTFRATELVDEHLAVFIQVPIDALITMPAIARVLIGAMLNAMIVADGRGENQKVLFMIDEAARLGRMKVLEMIRDAGRKYRIAMHMLWQSVGQMEEIWGAGGRKSWYDNATWRAYSSVRDQQAAKDISDACGTFGAMAFSEGDNAGRQGGPWNASLSRGRNLNRHEIRRELLKPQEVVSDLPLGEVIILGLPQPLRLRRAMWWERPELAAQIEDSRFHQKQRVSA